MTRIDAEDDDLGMVRPARPSTGGSRRATFERRSSPFGKVNEVLLLGTCELASDSESLESLSHKPGYFSLIDFVGLSSRRLVSVRARPFSSMVNTTEVRGFSLADSEIDPSDVLPMRLSGEQVRGACVTLLLLVSSSIALEEAYILRGRAPPVVLLLCRPSLLGAIKVSVVETVSVRECIGCIVSEFSTFCKSSESRRPLPDDFLKMLRDGAGRGSVLVSCRGALCTAGELYTSDGSTPDELASSIGGWEKVTECWTWEALAGRRLGVCIAKPVIAGVLKDTDCTVEVCILG